MGVFKPAVKYLQKLRAAIFGPAGAGKTMTALLIAMGMAMVMEKALKRKIKIAVIDSERGSASKYSDRFAFDTVELKTRSVDEYISYINSAQREEYDILIIDSGSHAWQETLAENSKLANTKYRGNSWGAWNESTPKYKAFVQAIMDFKGHVIVTMRSKTEWSQEKDESGKVKPVKVGLAPEMRSGVEFEFDILMELNPDHWGTVSKDRTGKFQDRIIEKPDSDFGKELIEWLNEGAVPPPEAPAPVAPASAAPAVAPTAPEAAPVAQTAPEVKEPDYNINPVKCSKQGKPWSEHTPIELAMSMAVLLKKPEGKMFAEAIQAEINARAKKEAAAAVSPEQATPAPAAVPAAPAPVASTPTTSEAAPVAQTAPEAKEPGDEATGPAFEGKVTDASPADVQTLAEGEDPFSKESTEDEKEFFDMHKKA